MTGVGLLANISCVSSFPHYCFSDQPSCWHIQQIKPNVRKKRDWIIEKIAEKKLAVNNFKWHIIDALRENYSFVFTVLTPLSLRVVSVQPVKMTSSESVLYILRNGEPWMKFIATQNENISRILDSFSSN